MRLEARKYLYDVQNACNLLARFTAGKTLADYASDPLLRSAVERQFEIVGEALGQMRKVEPGLCDAISESRRIIAFRNILVHGYASVSDEVVWDILMADLPRLSEEVRVLLERAEG
jgi:uncharacterized protein with HEPN domain